MINKHHGFKTVGLFIITLLSLLLGGCDSSVNSSITSESSTTPSQGFAGLGADATGFAQVQPNPTILYPDALNQQPDYRIEWWYVTANLIDETGAPMGIQWTLFRHASSPSPQQEGWANQQLWLGHIGVTTAQQHLSSDRYGRGGVGQAGVTMAPFKAWIDHWSLSRVENEPEPPTSFNLIAQSDQFGYDLVLQKSGPAVLQGEQGFSVKSPQGQASYYMSLPFLDVSGSVWIDENTYQVKGQAWLDREWSSQPLSADQEGWDWFSLHLDNQDKLMLFRLRHQDSEDFFSGTYIHADGRTQPLRSDQIVMQPIHHHPIAHRRIPTSWQLIVDDLGIDLRAEALNPNAWMSTQIAYWEGPIQFTGSHQGVGYLEMTGY